MDKPLPLAISLMGPTASGKTALAIELCQRMPCEIISVDSALIYKGMDIGTAKPTTAELAQAPHRLIDIKDPAEVYSVAEFRRDAIREMQNIQQRGNIPLLVGGTMMYFKALVEGISPLPEADTAVRTQIEEESKQKGWGHLHAELEAIDKVSAKRIHPNDPQRLTRAIEVYRITGKSLTQLSETKLPPIPYNLKQFAIAPEERIVLHNRIAQRFELMLQQGFEQEVAELRKRANLHLDLPSMRCVGYRQMWEYLDGKVTQQEMIFRAIAATRQLAKRQLTWLRGWQNLQWLDTFAENNAEHIQNS